MEEGEYFVECALLQWCHAEGETIGEAISNIQDVIRIHKECRKEFHVNQAIQEGLRDYVTGRIVGPFRSITEFQNSLEYSHD